MKWDTTYLFFNISIVYSIKKDREESQWYIEHLDTYFGVVLLPRKSIQKIKPVLPHTHKYVFVEVVNDQRGHPSVVEAAVF